MILDYMKNIDRYGSLVGRLKEGMAFVNAVKDNEPGRYEKEGMYAIVEKGITAKKSDIYEAHRKYIDVQCVFYGRELVIWQDVSLLKEYSPFDKEKDLALLTGAGKSFVADAGMFYMLFPHDAHMGGGIADKACELQKVILKLPVE